MGTYHRYYGRPIPERRYTNWYTVAAIATMTLVLTCWVALALSFITPARADPPPPMWEGGITVNTVVCKTKDQADSIANAAHDSTAAMIAKYQELVATKDCVNSPIPDLVVNEREDFGMGHAANGDMMHMWVVHGGTARGEFWLIYAETGEQQPA
jgi:hypothetical protein